MTFPWTLWCANCFHSFPTWFKKHCWTAGLKWISLSFERPKSAYIDHLSLLHQLSFQFFIILPGGSLCALRDARTNIPLFLLNLFWYISSILIVTTSWNAPKTSLCADALGLWMDTGLCRMSLLHMSELLTYLWQDPGMWHAIHPFSGCG